MAGNNIFLTVTADGSTPLRGFTATLNLTDNMFQGLQYRAEATSDRNGLLTFDLSADTVSAKYEYTATITSDSQTIDVDTYLPSSFRYIARLTDNGEGGFNDYNLRIATVKVASDTVDVITAKEEVDSAYSTYIAVKESYDALIANATTITLEQVETYEPARANYVVTRMLEFQTGTVLPAIRYATAADLSEQLALLQRINRSITQYASLYPSITINDGEGIPYQ